MGLFKILQKSQKNHYKSLTVTKLVVFSGSPDILCFMHECVPKSDQNSKNYT